MRRVTRVTEILTRRYFCVRMTVLINVFWFGMNDKDSSNCYVLVYQVDHLSAGSRVHESLGLILRVLDDQEK